MSKHVVFRASIVSKHVVFRASIVSKHVVAELGKYSISTSFEWCEKETF